MTQTTTLGGLNIQTRVEVKCNPDGSEPILTLIIINLPCGEIAQKVAQQLLLLSTDLLEAVSRANPLCATCPATGFVPVEDQPEETPTCH